MVETMRLMKAHELEAEELSFSPENLAKLIELVDAGTINGNVAKEVFEKIFLDNIDPVDYVDKHGLKMDNDVDGLKVILEKIISDNPQSVEDYNNGKKKAIGFLVGQAMKETKGKANPGVINKMIQEMLDKN